MVEFLLAGPAPGECMPYTKADEEGPFFEVFKMWIIVIKTVVQEDAPKSYKLAPASELDDPEVAVLLKGEVSEVFWEAKKCPGGFWLKYIYFT